MTSMEDAAATTLRLVIHTAFEGAHVGVFRGGALAGGDIVSMPPQQRQSQALVDLIRRALDVAGVAAADLGGIVVNHGPGLFTGIRVGMAAAIGLSLAHAIPVYGMSSFAALTPLTLYRDRNNNNNEPWGILVPSGREEIFYSEGCFDGETIRFSDPVQDKLSCIMGKNARKIRIFAPQEGIFDGIPDNVMNIEQINPLNILKNMDFWQKSMKTGHSARFPSPFYGRMPDITTPKDKLLTK